MDFPFKLAENVLLWRRNMQYTLDVCGVTVFVTREQVHAMLVKVLPESELVWSVNGDEDSTFHEKEFPDWSVKPHPADLVAGNIYYRHKQAAERALKEAKMARLQTMKDRAEKFAQEVGLLCS